MLTYDCTHAVSLERLKAAFLGSDYMTGDSFTESLVSVYDTLRFLESGDQNTTETSDPLSSANTHFGKDF